MIKPKNIPYYRKITQQCASFSIPLFHNIAKIQSFGGKNKKLTDSNYLGIEFVKQFYKKNKAYKYTISSYA